MQPDTLHSLHFGAGLRHTLWCRGNCAGGAIGGQSGPWTPLVGWCGHVHPAPPPPLPWLPPAPVVWWLQSKATVRLAARLAQTLSAASPALPSLPACSYPCPPETDLVHDLHLVPWCLVQKCCLVIHNDAPFWETQASPNEYHLIPHNNNGEWLVTATQGRAQMKNSKPEHRCSKWKQPVVYYCTS